MTKQEIEQRRRGLIKQMKSLEEAIDKIYEDWLLEFCPEDIESSDDHIKKAEDLFAWDEFVKWMEKDG